MQELYLIEGQTFSSSANSAIGASHVMRAMKVLREEH
jgi:hypothetical protein